MTTVSRQHAAYVLAARKLFAAVDRHDTTAAINSIDTRLVDPVFNVMQEAIYAAASVARGNNLGAGRAVGQEPAAWSSLSTIMSLLVGLGLIVLGSRARCGVLDAVCASNATLNLHHAFHDSFTGLPNRALFQDRTAQALRAARRSGSQIAVMLVDLNRFKDVNDTLGHHYGDLLLGQVAQRFSRRVARRGLRSRGSAVTSSRCC